MASNLRRLIVLVASAMLVTVAFAASAVALSPSPGEGQPASPGLCAFAVTPTNADGTIPPGSVTVSVTSLPDIDESLTVQLFVNGSVAQSLVVAPPAVLPITFNPINVVAGDSISVNYILRGVSTYSTVCATLAGQVVVRVQVGGIQATRLAFSGSSNTSTLVLVGATAVVLGMVFVVGTRRRRRVNV